MLSHRGEYGREVFLEHGLFGRLQRGEDSITQLRGVLKDLLQYTGVENNEIATNEQEHADRRHSWVRRIVSALETLSDRLRARSATPDTRIVLAALAQVKERLDTVHLLIGGPTRGKTSTIASLWRQLFYAQRDSTRGIDLSVYYVVVERRRIDERESNYLQQKDKFQAKLHMFHAKSQLQEESIVETGSSPSAMSQHISVADGAEIQTEITPESVMHG